MLIKEIVTSLASHEIFSIFKKEKYSFFLDSGIDHKKLGQYSFIGFNPYLTFKSKNKEIEIIINGKREVFYGDVFDHLENLVNTYKFDYKIDIPFISGFVGYFSYDLGNSIEELPRTAFDDINIPDCYLGLYDGIIIFDHINNKTFVSAIGIKENCEEIIERIINKIKENERNHIEHNLSVSKKNTEFECNFTKEEYIQAIEKIRSYIKAGDVYEVNLSQRFSCDLDHTPYELYVKLRNINPAPFANFIDFGDGCIVGSSPERFLKVRKGIIETRPIKGTIGRGKTQEEDNKNKEKLLNSEKDKSELLMIVDLERNDLGKISKTGTVKVSQILGIEEYATVYHLVSTVVGEIKDNYSTVECIKAMFPGGSITGAPKIRSMEIIDELEPTRRSAYTGSVGYIGLNGNVDLNIVIRSIICKNKKAYFQAGGAIVWDSNPELEYEETLCKVKALMDAIRA
ncbi:aminodeoxychorismate synthase component I [Clostridium taeniosporum]|uniref:Anthranilate synthase component 1 n=1 Tax=Clostridium taeniosporum TaxID=394958 RepID=A0A1D7XHN5_9CLOT|nr:aminodeoxychorismate synthase component I [Clostridium taeniosporum]AOR22650.1 aminodeoxychorismate synthase, component I [Clostridium taeniosporum]